MSPSWAFHETVNVGQMELNSIAVAVIILSSTIRSGSLDTIVIIKSFNIVLGR